MRPTGIWMKIYWADYFADTLHLDTLQHGAYLLMIGAYWRRGEALPDDDRFLANVTKLSLKKWKMVRPILSKFFEIQEGHWIHKRVETEILNSCSRSARASLGGCSRAAKSEVRGQSHKESKEVVEVVPKKERPKTRGTRLPNDWHPSSEGLSFAKEKLGGSAIEEFARFTDYWRAVPGQKGTKLDWDATWRNWIRNSNGGMNGPGRSRPLQDNSLSASRAAARLADAAERGEFSFSPRPSLHPEKSTNDLLALPKGRDS